MAFQLSRSPARSLKGVPKAKLGLEEPNSHFPGIIKKPGLFNSRAQVLYKTSFPWPNSLAKLNNVGSEIIGSKAQMSQSCSWTNNVGISLWLPDFSLFQASGNWTILILPFCPGIRKRLSFQQTEVRNRRVYCNKNEIVEYLYPEFKWRRSRPMGQFLSISARICLWSTLVLAQVRSDWPEKGFFMGAPKKGSSPSYFRRVTFAGFLDRLALGTCLSSSAFDFDRIFPNTEPRRCIFDLSMLFRKSLILPC